MRNSKYLVLFTLFVSNLVDQQAPEVKIEQGILSGITSADGSYFAYVGIPYATTNSSTRFKAPLPPPSWSGIYKATQYYSCSQPRAMGTVEDCLKVNVYVPAMAKKPLPVMVYIHGGAFYLGSGSNLLYGPDFLVKHDVILVTLNYRLGVFGFTCLGIKEAPGNAGLKDQLAALRWIKQNIAAFGGDPDNITLFGESAGAVSTSIHVASDRTEGLFHKAIMLSGSSVSTFAINRDPLGSARLVAQKLGYDIEDPQKIYELLTKVSAQELIEAHLDRPIEGKYSDTELIHLPCIEKEIPGEERVLTDFPYKMIINITKNIPLIYGTTSNEGLYLISILNETLLELKDRQYLFTSDLEFSSEEEAEKVNEKLRQHYLGDEKMSQASILKVSNILGDLYFGVPATIESEIMVNKNNTHVYNYLFDYVGGRNFVKQLIGYTDAPGASHGDTILYLFAGNIWPFPINYKDRGIIDVMTKMWTNFAKYGNPSPNSDLPFQWLPSTREGLRHLHISDEIKMGSLPNQESHNLWKSIYDKYRKMEINPV